MDGEGLKLRLEETRAPRRVPAPRLQRLAADGEQALFGQLRRAEFGGAGIERAAGAEKGPEGGGVIVVSPARQIREGQRLQARLPRQTGCGLA